MNHLAQKVDVLIFLLGHIVPVTELMARPSTPTLKKSMFCLIFLLGHIVPVTELMTRPSTPTHIHTPHYYCQFNSQSELDRSWVSSCHGQ